MSEDEARRIGFAARYITLKDTPKARRRCRKRTLRTISLLESHLLQVRAAHEPDMFRLAVAEVIRGCEVCGRCKEPPFSITQPRSGAG